MQCCDLFGFYSRVHIFALLGPISNEHVTINSLEYFFFGQMEHWTCKNPKRENTKQQQKNTICTIQYIQMCNKTTNAF